MLNIIDEKVGAIRQVAEDQRGHMRVALNALADNLQQAQTRHTTSMKVASAKREEATKIEDVAERELTTTLHNVLTSVLTMLQQLDDGMMVTGSIETPALTKPKLVMSGAQAVAS